MRYVKSNHPQYKNAMYVMDDNYGGSVELWWRTDMGEPCMEWTLCRADAPRAKKFAELLRQATEEAEAWVANPPWDREI